MTQESILPEVVKESTLIRAHYKFIETIEKIRDQRKELGMRKLSYAKITSLMTRHNYWGNVMGDIVNYIGEEDVD